MLKKLTKGSIRKRLAGMIFLIVTLVTLVSYALFAFWYIHDQKKQSREEAQTVAYVIAQDLAKLVLLNSVSAASDITAKLDSFPFLNWLILYKKDGTPIYQYSKSHQSFDIKTRLEQETDKEGHYLIHKVKAVYQHSYLGDIHLSIKIRSVKEILFGNAWWFLFIYVLMIISSYFLAHHYAKKFTKPILELVQFLEGIDFSMACQQRIRLDEANEFAILESKVNAMLEGLEDAFAQQQLAAVAFETPSGMIITDAHKCVIQVNRAYSEITGYRLEDVIGKKPPVLRCEVEEVSRYEAIERALHEQHYWAGEIKNCKKDGGYFIEYLTIQKVRNDKGETTHYVFSFIDLSLQKEVEKKVAYLMQYDPLTGLANKSMLIRRLEEITKESAGDRWHALIGFDIKDFKTINDAYGYETGDRILQEVTSRLKELFSDSDVIAKIGVDEFILSYYMLDHKKASAVMQIEMTAEYLISVMSKTFMIDDKAIHLGIQVGINLYRSGEDTTDDILKNTDAALQLAKKKEEKIAFFNKEIEVKAKERLDVYTDLQHAIENTSFELYYQPQYSVDGTMCGAEALIRWIHPVKGIIPPDQFIPIAEKSGLIIDIGRWVLNRACQELAKWRKEPKFSHLSIAVNVSAKQFAAHDFVQQVQDAVLSHAVPYHQLKLELVESVLLIDKAKTIRKMKMLRKLGVQISMDDFGTGYSSLEYLKELPLNQIKIDRSFISHMHTDKKDLAIVKTMISLGDAFGFEVIAEGVEKEEDITLLGTLGCQCYQGYYFSRPLPAKAFLEL
jgi:diguanylate cyclase (GGDEF)-like protein/PAS domain S-box-containing protein